MKMSDDGTGGVSGEGEDEPSAREAAVRARRMTTREKNVVDIISTL